LPATRSAKRRLEFLCDAVDLLDFFHEAPEPDFLPEEPARQGSALLGDADDAQREAQERRDDQDERCPLFLRQTVKEAHERYRASEQGEQHLIFGLEERHDERDEEQPRFSPRDFQALQRAGRQPGLSRAFRAVARPVPVNVWAELGLTGEERGRRLLRRLPHRRRRHRHPELGPGPCTGRDDDVYGLSRWRCNPEVCTRRRTRWNCDGHRLLLRWRLRARRGGRDLRMIDILY
jgi:hypothetical protein